MSRIINIWKIVVRKCDSNVGRDGGGDGGDDGGWWAMVAIVVMVMMMVGGGGGCDMSCDGH